MSVCGHNSSQGKSRADNSYERGSRGRKLGGGDEQVSNIVFFSYERLVIGDSAIETGRTLIRTLHYPSCIRIYRDQMINFC